MTDWKLNLENIGGFKGLKEFTFKRGINLIVGDNATGKSSIINSLKLLNKLFITEEFNDTATYRDFINDRTKHAYITLNNESRQFHLYLPSPVGKITSYLGDKRPQTKSKNIFISEDPNTVKFSFIDKSNKLMESIEYSGTIELIKEEIIRLSNINNYELIQNQAKKLKLEYSERRERDVKKLNDERKEIELRRQEILRKLDKYQEKLKGIQYDEEITEKLSLLKDKLVNLNKDYIKNDIKEFEPLVQDYNKTVAKTDKIELKLANLKNKKVDLENFLELENTIIENEKRIEDYDQKLVDLKEVRHKINLNRLQFLENIRILNETLEKSENNIICQHCLNPINTKILGKKIEELDSNKNDVLENLRAIESEIQEITNKRNKLNTLLMDQKNIPSKLSNINSDINNLKKKLSVNKEKIKTMEQDINNKRQLLSNKQLEIDNCQKEIIKISSHDEKIKEKYIEIIAKINLIKDNNNELNAKKSLLVQKIVILPENYNILIKRLDYFIKRLNSYIESFYIEFIDSINSELSLLLDKLNWSFREVFIDDNLNLIIKNLEGKPQKFHSLSSFEKKSISIILLLIIKMKYYPDYPLFVIDEHLNSADSERFIKFIPHLYENVLKDNLDLFILTSLPNEAENELTSSWDKNQYEDLTIYYRQ